MLIYIYIQTYIRRKFRSRTSDNMDRWKAEVGRVTEEKKKKKEDQGRERARRQKMQVREKVAKSRNTVFFQWFVAPEGRKVGSLKRRVRSHVVRWERKICTPLWREALLQVKQLKTPHFRMSKKVHAMAVQSTFQSQKCKKWRSQSTFGSWDVEKAHAAVARSTFPSHNVQSTPCSDHFWKLTCRKSVRRCGAKHISKSKV